MENILFTIIALSLMVALLEMTFQYFMQPNMILYPYSALLSYIANKGEVWRHLMRPLGRCRYCNATWITFYAYKYALGLDLYVLFAFGMTTLFVNLLTKYVFSDVDPATKTDSAYGIEYNSDTPVKAMLYSYVILGVFYATVYLLLPLLF